MSDGNGEVFNLDDYGIAKNEDGSYRMDASATGMVATALKLAKAMGDEGWGEKAQVKAFLADLHTSPERRTGIGIAACRESVGQNVWLSVSTVSLKKKPP